MLVTEHRPDRSGGRSATSVAVILGYSRRVRREAEAGTDAAGLCLYDPAALPDEFDRLCAQDLHAALECAQDDGRLIFANTGSDGAFLLHLYVDEPLPEAIARYAVEPLDCELAVPSGQLVFCGSEYAHKHETPATKKHPHMLERTRLEVPPGQYRVRLFRTEYPDDIHEARLKATVPGSAERVFRTVNALIAASIVGVLAGLLLLATPVRGWLWWYAPILVVLVLVTSGLRRSRGFQQAQARWDSIQRELPSIVAQLTTIRSGSA